MTKPSPFAPQPPEPSNREKMKDAVQQLMRHVKDQKAETQAEMASDIERQRKRRQRRIVQAVFLALLLIVAVALSLPRWRHPFPPPSGAAAIHDSRRALVFASNLVERFVRDTGRLPSTFAQIGVSLPGVVYTQTGATYTLTMSVEGRDIIFRRGDHPAEFMRQP